MTKYIFLRGLPNTGKTKIAHKLERTLSDSTVIHGDDDEFKTFKGNKTIYHYEKIIESLFVNNSKSEYIIFDETICDDKLYNKIKQQLQGNNYQSYWFKLEDNIETLLQREQKRKRKYKNKLEDFTRLQEQINSIIIPNETTISNQSIDKTTDIIMQTIEKN